eukprot:CAMPEP_0172540480 /NCGR_PEP_ID=MMETSP1067-20121228/11483_1 /TAXON_ID=265564 ORGANISM="Thalassiosira punctigera, Strain Tpunct2005C2" /NCGR_SAMPLE_ID=MMETSP1067 /ASSEMBLY_ACC=CAM_ASM_000444 /LENGTH=279 /DNA_ID=CAMNT_0013326349 /DNA_START=78 /DNA_END=917 /DNA_ORIENTATION=-
MTMMNFTFMACRNIGALASRASTRHSSTLLRSAASTLASSNATIISRNTPKHHISPPSPFDNANAIQSRSLSTSMPRRGFPQYTIFGPDSALAIRAVLPTFKRAGHDGVSVDRRGKLVLEFVPRNNTGAGFAWSDKTLFSLSVEEVGLCLSQLPNNCMELTHATYSAAGQDEEVPSGLSGVTQLGGDPVEKVLTVEPGEGATLKFKVDYMKAGVGGQNIPGMEGLPMTPMEITIQAGEFEVLKSIFQSSIPYLLGWNTTMDIASAASISKGINGNNQMY